MAAKQIFIVEDEALLLCELEDLVVDLGYELAGSATSVDRAMDKLSDGLLPDAALLDLNLNGMPSDPVADRLVERGVPIIFVSGYGARAKASQPSPPWAFSPKTGKRADRSCSMAPT